MQVIALLIGLGSLGCWIATLVTIFKNSSVIMGILGIFCPLFAFIYGWVKSSEWGNRTLMTVWTALVVLGMVVNIAIAFSHAGAH